MTKPESYHHQLAPVRSVSFRLGNSLLVFYFCLQHIHSEQELTLSYKIAFKNVLKTSHGSKEL